jgi:hypothetical protein
MRVRWSRVGGGWFGQSDSGVRAFVYRSPGEWVWRVHDDQRILDIGAEESEQLAMERAVQAIARARGADFDAEVFAGLRR